MTNFGAMTCGAKILATNPEARNQGSALNENKDQYMIQPCKAKKWYGHYDFNNSIIEF